jgi:ubiquinone/menaquinone biosynthesis C-methylase UbiE
MGVTYYSPPNNDFTALYISLRKKEGRFYSDDQIKQLPDIAKNHTHYQEWQLRKKSAHRFVKYLESKRQPLRILDVGCGNGWFSHFVSTVERTEVTGLDVNSIELEQAATIFAQSNLSFACADLQEQTALNEQQFDVIVFNSCLQYFKNPLELFRNMSVLLAEKGEIHVIDSPFYNSNSIENAQQRTKNYYRNLGFPQMAENYFHHELSDIGNYKIMYEPATGILKYLKRDSPFCWIKIEKL